MFSPFKVGKECAENGLFKHAWDDAAVEARVWDSFDDGQITDTW